MAQPLRKPQWQPPSGGSEPPSFWWRLFAVIAAGIIYPFIYHEWNTFDIKSLACRAVVTYDGLPIPATGSGYTYVPQATAPLTIHAYGDNHYWVKLTNAYTGQPISGHFIRAGETLKTTVPPGVVDFRFARGSTWYGPDFLFGSSTTLFATEPLSFGEREGHIITLQPTIGGNLQQKTISASEW